nr:ribonuclease H-like domain-containing protein [Tanacetum cinerariifolium]
MVHVLRYLHTPTAESTSSPSAPLTPEELKAELRFSKLGDQSMESYFQKIDSIVNILASLDARVNDEDVIHYVLKGLSDTYNHVCGYMHWKDTFLYLKTVRSLLITEEMRLKSRTSTLVADSSSLMVLVAKSGNTRRSSSTPQVKSSKPCFNFAKGNCRYCATCRYSHDANARSVGDTVGVNKNHGNNDTNELLAKLLTQLGNLGFNTSVSPNANTTNPPVAFHDGPSSSLSPNVGLIHYTPSGFNIRPRPKLLRSLPFYAMLVSLFVWVYPLVRKSNVLSKFILFLNYVRTQFKCEIHAFQYDHSGKFDNHNLHDLFNTHGIQFCFSCRKTSQQNDESERMVRTLNNIIQTLLFKQNFYQMIGLRPFIWPFTSLTFYPPPLLTMKSPLPAFVALHLTIVSYVLLDAYATHLYPNHKLEPRATPFLFLGHASNHRGYRCFDLTTNKIIISRHVTFDETIFLYGSSPSTMVPSYTFLDEPDINPPPGFRFHLPTSCSRTYYTFQ